MGWRGSTEKGRGIEKNHREGEKKKVRQEEKPGGWVSGGKAWGEGWVQMQHVANTRERSREGIAEDKPGYLLSLPVALRSRAQEMKISYPHRTVNCSQILLCHGCKLRRAQAVSCMACLNT